MMTGTLMLSADEQRLYVADPDRDALYLVDTGGPGREWEPLRFEARLELDPGEVPFRMAADGDGRVHVTTRQGGALLTVDAHLDGVLARRSVCPSPRGLAYEAARDRVHVACADGDLVSFEADPEGVEVARVRLSPDLRDVVVGEDRLFVSRFRAAEVIEVSLEDGGVLLAYSPREHQSAWESPTYSANTALRLLMLPDGDLLLLHQWSRSGPIATAPPMTNPTGYYGDGRRCDAFVLSGMTRLRPGYGDVGQRSIPAPALLADVAAFGDNGVQVVSAVESSSDRPGDVPLVSGPTQPEERRCGRMFGRTPGTAIVAGQTAIYTWRSEPPSIERPAVGATRQSELVLSELSLVASEGHALFHRLTPSGLACASCHPEGGDDGHVWNVVGVGPRRTPPLLGGVVAEGPFHWSGDVADMRSILQGTFVNRMGGEAPEEGEVEDFDAWVVDLLADRPPVSGPDVHDLGRTAFEAAGCATCHSGGQARFGDRGLHDVGTGGTFRTPPLLGVAVRAPYFHDGCAETIEATVDGTCSETHLVVDEAERAAVLEYLRTR